MTWNTDLDTTALDELTWEDGRRTATGELALEHWAGEYGETCNGFAFGYQDANPDAVVKVACVNGIYHAYVYDPNLDATIDATLGQFDGHATVGMWDGETHPHIDDDQEPPEEYHDRESFKKAYDKPFSPFYV